MYIVDLMKASLLLALAGIVPTCIRVLELAHQPHKNWIPPHEVPSLNLG
jgi:hypothetical protein